MRNQAPRMAAQAWTLTVNRCHYTVCLQHAAVRQDRPIGPADTFREHRHNLYHIVLYVEGQGSFRLEGRTETAQPGTLVLVSPGQLHDFISGRGSAIYSEVTFSIESAEGLVLELPFETVTRTLVGHTIRLPAVSRLDSGSRGRLEQIVEHIITQAMLDSPLNEYNVQCGFNQLFELLVRCCAEYPRPPEHADERLLRVRQFIQENYTDSLSIEDLAHLVHMSKGHFLRSFKRAFGLPPLAYQQQLRLEAAKTLLRVSALPCNEVAIRCGYDNVPFFHRLFKRRTGVTPKQYRRQSLLSTSQKRP